MVLLLSFLGVQVNAQSIVSTAGNTAANASYSLTFSVGEPISGDFGTSELSFASGFASISSLLITTSEEEAQILPEKFDLSQNYLNPFNPSTTIQYSLPKSTAMRIEVFNSIGRLVALLADEQQAAGQMVRSEMVEVYTDF